MASVHEIKAELRAVEGKGASRRLRRADKVPAVLYGAKQPPANIQLDHKLALLYSQNEWFYSAVLTMHIDGQVQKVLFRDIQRHAFKLRIQHLDFQRVSETDKLKLKVPLHFFNQEISPAGKTAGVVITHEMNEIEVYCLPKDIPEHLEVDLSELSLGDILHVSQIKLPEGISIPSLRLGKEHDLAVALARHARVEIEAVSETEADATAVAAPAKGAAPAKAAAPAKKK